MEVFSCMYKSKGSHLNFKAVVESAAAAARIRSELLITLKSDLNKSLQLPTMSFCLLVNRIHCSLVFYCFTDVSKTVYVSDNMNV